MPYILVVIISFCSGGIGGNCSLNVSQQEYGTQPACEAAAHFIAQQSSKAIVKCLAKNGEL